VNNTTCPWIKEEEKEDRGNALDQSSLQQAQNIVQGSGTCQVSSTTLDLKQIYNVGTPLQFIV